MSKSRVFLKCTVDSTFIFIDIDRMVGLFSNYKKISITYIYGWVSPRRPRRGCSPSAFIDPIKTNECVCHMIDPPNLATLALSAYWLACRFNQTSSLPDLQGRGSSTTSGHTNTKPLASSAHPVCNRSIWSVLSPHQQTPRP